MIDKSKNNNHTTYRNFNVLMLFFYYYFQMHKYKQINNESLVTGLLTRSFLYQDRTLERKKGQNKEKINKEKNRRRKANE